MSRKYLLEPKPPVCLHIMGQGLVDILWSEGREAIKTAQEGWYVTQTTQEHYGDNKASVDRLYGPFESHANANQFMQVKYDAYVATEGDNSWDKDDTDASCFHISGSDKTIIWQTVQLHKD